MDNAIENVSRLVKISSLTEGFAPFRYNPLMFFRDMARAGMRRLDWKYVTKDEKQNDFQSLGDVIASLGMSAGGRKHELATIGVDPRLIPDSESYDRTFARALGVEDVPVVTGKNAVFFGVRPRYDGVMGQLQLPTMDTPANVTKQLGRAAVDLNPNNRLVVRAGKRVLPRAATGVAAGAAGSLAGLTAGTLLGGPVGGVIGGYSAGMVASPLAMSATHYAASKAADDLIRQKISPIATKQFMDNYNQASRLSRRGILGRALPIAAVGALIPALYYLKSPFQNAIADAADENFNLRDHAETLENALSQNSFGRALLDYSARR
jgi:hypothetical protein